jgi:hypothetical protein
MGALRQAGQQVLTLVCPERFFLTSPHANPFAATKSWGGDCVVLR